MRPATPLLRTSRLGLVATMALAVLVAGIAPGLLGTPTPKAQAAAANIAPVEEAASWLTGQLQSGLLGTPDADGPAYYDPAVEASIEAALGLGQILGYDAAVAEIQSAVVAEAHDFAHPVREMLNAPVGQAFLVGPTAQLASYAYRTGLDPTNFGNPNADLIDEILQSIDTDGADIGRVRDRFVDASAIDMVDFTGQDRAEVLALARSIDAVIRARADLPTLEAAELDSEVSAMIGYLQLQQCDLGGLQGRYFRANFAADSCDASAGVARAPNAQVTARIALLLQDLADDGLAQAPLDTMLTQTVTWLQLVQKPSGSFDANAITTGYSGLVLQRSGATTAARAAAAWLRDLQWFHPTPCGEEALTHALGALAPDKTAYELAKSTGPGSNLGWRRATASALPLLQFTPYLAGPPSLTAPNGFVHAGSNIELQVTRADDHERLCLSGPKLTGRSVPVNESVESIQIVAPAGTKDRVYQVAAIDGSDTAVLRVLDGTTFKVRLKFRSVRRGAKQKVVVVGLASGERVRIRVNGKKVAKGKANANGKFKKRFKVKTRKVKAKVTVRGRFDDRTGRARFRVR